MIKKISGWPLFFALLASCFSSEEKWVLESLKGQPYSRLSLSSKTFPKTTLEFLFLQNHIRTFFTFEACPIFPTEDKSVAFRLYIDNVAYERKGHLYEGNQRFALDERTSLLLIQALQEERTIEMNVNGYQIAIDSHSFSSYYKKLIQKKSPWELPFFSSFIGLP